MLQVIVAVVVANLEETYNSHKKRMDQESRTLRKFTKSTMGQKNFQRPIVDRPDNDSPVWKSQVPFEIPVSIEMNRPIFFFESSVYSPPSSTTALSPQNLDLISVKKLEKYFLLIAIMEENLSEFVRLKDMINDVSIHLLRLWIFILKHHPRPLLS